MLCVSPGDMLEEMARTFAEKVPGDYEMTAVFAVDTGDEDPFQWHIRCSGDEVHWDLGRIEDPDTIFTLSEATLRDLYDGRWSGLTAAGRAHVADPAPLDFTLPPGVNPLEAMRRGYFFITHFFSTDNQGPGGGGHRLPRLPPGRAGDGERPARSRNCPRVLPCDTEAAGDV
ncbi:MAG: hypothetical protein R6U70_04835 [Bacillota bacterium]